MLVSDNNSRFSAERANPVSRNDNSLQELEDLEVFELFIDDRVSIETAFDNILEKARNSDLDPLSFCQLAQQKLEEGKLLNESQINQIQELAKHIQNSLDGEKTFQILEEKIKEKSPDLEDYFIQNIDNLKLFLCRKHKEMLALPPEKAAEKQEEFRHIKHTFRDLFLSLAKKNKDVSGYDTYLNNSFGRLLTNREGFESLLFCFFSDNGKDIKNQDDFESFLDELANFRKNYLCRYSIHKVEKIINEQIINIRFDLFDPNESHLDNKLWMLEETKTRVIKITDESLYALKTTFIHGSHSAILCNLPASDMKLIPIGHLIHKGIIPLSGELQEGAVLDERAMKKSEISATTLDDGFRPMGYSDSFHTNVDEEKNYLTVFLKKLKDKNHFKDFLSIRFAYQWARYSIAILRLRLMDEQFFNEHYEELSAGIENLTENFDFFKTTDEYKQCMPKELDPDGTMGYQHHDYYYSYQFDKGELILNSLKQALTKPLKENENINRVEKPFPIVFGSTNIHTKSYGGNNYLERRTQKFCQLGKDIDFLVVNRENMEEINAYLKEHHLEEKVKVIDKDTFEQAILLNKLASPYFADFASHKKLTLQSITFAQRFWNACKGCADQIYDQYI